MYICGHVITYACNMDRDILSCTGVQEQCIFVYMGSHVNIIKYIAGVTGHFIMYRSARTMYFCVYGITCKYYIIHSRSYWSRSWPFNNENFSSLMSSRRFELILRFLHLNYSETQPQRGEPGFDKLYKVRPFLELLLQNFKGSYLPGQHLSIDESMISYKGRLIYSIPPQEAPQVGNEGLGAC